MILDTIIIIIVLLYGVRNWNFYHAQIIIGVVNICVQRYISIDEKHNIHKRKFTLRIKIIRTILDYC